MGNNLNQNENKSRQALIFLRVYFFKPQVSQNFITFGARGVTYWQRVGLPRMYKVLVWSPSLCEKEKKSQHWNGHDLITTKKLNFQIKKKNQLFTDLLYFTKHCQGVLFRSKDLDVCRSIPSVDSVVTGTQYCNHKKANWASL